MLPTLEPEEFEERQSIRSAYTLKTASRSRIPEADTTMIKEMKGAKPNRD
jgi:hypothetical protein